MAMNRSILSTLFAIFIINQSVNADINSANAALANGDYAAASAEFLRLANDGDAKAQAHLGYMYYAGEGVEQNYEEAVKWYRKAAVQGDKDAQYNLAVAYAFGEGTKQDYKESALWYRRAAEQGHAIAQYSLGISYSYGEGVKQDSKEAVKWFQMSAEQGYSRSQVQLAAKYHTGDGVALDYQEAVKWYRKAADKGDAAAQYNLGSMYRSGKGVKQDYNQSVRWYRLAADQGYAAATNELASLERAIAGAQRNRSRPNLQPSTQISKTEEAPASLPLVEVEKSDLLTLDATEESDKADDVVMATAEPETDTQLADESVAEAMEEEKKPGRISGFFKKFFKKDQAEEVASDAEVIDDGMIEMTMQDEAVSTDEIMSEPAEEMVEVVDSVDVADDSSSEMIVEADEMASDVPEKKSRFGFFKKLFGKNNSGEEVVVEDRGVEEVVEEASLEMSAETDTEETMPAMDDSDMAMADSTETETMEIEEQPRKKGFFGRLFGKKDKEMGDETEALETDTVAMLGDESDAVPVMKEEIEIDSNSEEQAAMDALEVEEEPKKKGFFGRLFGKKDKEMVDEPEAMETETVAMLDEETNAVPVIEEEIEIDSSGEEQAAMDALEVEEEPEKKGFFGRLFGKKDGDSEQADDAQEGVSSDESDSDEESDGPEYVADADTLTAARELLDSGDYDSAYNSYYDLANAGDASAQYQLGLLYYQGLGIRQNYNEASYWYKEAGKKGNADAQYSLGNMYLMGEGVSQNDAEAILWYEKAADQGHVAAAHNVSNLKRVTSAGSSSTEEIESALENEQLEAGVDGVPEDYEEAPPEKKGFFKRLFSKDDEEEEEQAQPTVQGPLPEIQPVDEEVAEMQEVEEIEEVKEEKKGFFGRLFGKKDDDADAMEEAESTAESVETTMLESTDEPVAPAEPDQTFEEAVDSLKEYEQGLAYSFGDGVPQNDTLAFESFLRAAEMGHVPAQYKTGVAYAYGEGVGKNPEQALHWYKKAAGKGYALAQRNLGVIYMNGDGVEQNKVLAFAWQSILADKGNVMDVHRRDAMLQKLSEAEIEEAMSLKSSLKH
ncbi:MAG: hypothetical protein GKR93_09920 [Gammaproteobacteria bacterium]|nr:hypothetical protein [Gammaproteobacteria bacterium]